MTETVFVEEYRKELESTGYPFSQASPVTTATGYVLPTGTLVDASVYYDRPGHLPKLTAIEKKGPLVRFHVGESSGTLDLRNQVEVIELATSGGLFCGILVCHTDRVLAIRSWRDGLHSIVTPPGFCPRCLEYLPSIGVQRFRAETGELFSGDVVIASGMGGAIRSLTAKSGFTYAEIGWFGDPTYQIRTGDSDNIMPIQSIVCFDPDGESVILTPGKRQEIQFVACNTRQSNLFEDALRIGTIGSGIVISLGGL